MKNSTSKHSKSILPLNYGTNKASNNLRGGEILLSDRILDVMQTSVIFFDANNRIYRANTSALQDLRTKRNLSGVIVTDLLSVIHRNEDILPGIIGRLNVGATDSFQLPTDTFIRCRDGNTQFFISGSILRLEDDRYLLSFRNIMDEVTREHILSMVLARTKIFPWFYDMDRNKMLIDAHWFSYLGIPAGDCTMSSEDFFNRVHPDERKMLSEALRKQLSEEEIQDSFAYRLQRGDGTWEWFSEQSLYLSRTVDGSPYRIVGVCQSIQDHKTVEDTLRTARNKAQESDRLKTAFLANMSHEIRTPLNAIVGFAGLLTNEDIPIDSKERHEYMELINKNCDYLLTLISDILDLSRMETETMDFDFAAYSLEPILTEIYEKYTERVPSEVKFNLLLPPNDINVKTDIVRLRQILEHLLDNAVKFTETGQIDLGCIPSADGQHAALYVADTGRGIPKEQLSRIFDRFYKIDSFVQGAGLGLSVCKTLAEGLGGTIRIYSHPNEGSRFTLLLPLDPKRQSRQSIPNDIK